MADVLVAGEDGGRWFPREVGREGGCGDDAGASGEKAGFFDEVAYQGVKLRSVFLGGESFQHIPTVQAAHEARGDEEVRTEHARSIY